MLALAREQRLNEPALAAVRARLGAAHQLDALYQTDHAVELLRPIVEAKPAQPHGATASAWLALGEAHDRMGDRDSATAAYRAAIAFAPQDMHAIRSRANERLRKTPDQARTEAFKLSLDGFRRFERSDIAGAEAALSRSIALDPRDPVAHYRYGRVLQARRQEAPALAQFELTIRDARECPAPIVASAYLEAARLEERSGQIDVAIGYYRAAAQWFGGGADVRAVANRALARLKVAK
jgi:tetratricopeptide (TPR) repeat protein